jgi:hypothetical protein
MAKFWKGLRIIAIVLFVLYRLISLIPSGSTNPPKTEESEIPKLSVTRNKFGFEENWEWMDYYHRNYSLTFHVPYTDIKQGEHNRLYEIRALPMLPNEIDYSTLIKSGGISFMNDIINQLQSIAVAYNLDTRELADVTVSMIQNIPYTLIHQMSHESILKMAKEKHFDFLITYHNDPNNNPYDREWYGGCRDSVEPAGVFTPAEFISTMKGDCDTRTLLLFTLMKKMGYDVAIINGPGHSMLGCNLKPENPASPYITNNSSQYYFWETTFFYNQNGNTGPRLGEISDPEFNVKEWKIVLN